MMNCRIEAIVIEALRVKSFLLKPIEDIQLPAYTAGAHIDVYVSPDITRQYSLIKMPGLENQYMIGVLKDQNSRGGSEKIHADFIVGTEIKISEPRNLFALEEQAEHYILFAGGIGITPILSMALELHQQQKSFELHYCVRTLEHAAFKSQLLDSPISKYCYVHMDDQPLTKMDLTTILGTSNPQQHIYVCGPSGFIDYIHQTALENKWSEQQFHKENFSNTVDHTNDQSFELILADSNRILMIPADKSVLDILLENGLDVDCSCEQGICGTCVLEVIDGEVEHHDQFLTDEEKSSNKLFTPCCSRAKSKQLVIRL
ncbi:vanillate O-demethylase oxidoreductase [Acinetobacter calcoaceticus]|uniref:PDR/VanB family oxidoreductase n=1 Tax=Acinetobacter calcoaceticus TaxID=471 RepID=UPI00058261CF|nr:PDR/VanB family oxidoreductase [Acinetobacter calcoaceticus]GAM30574.1 vanillate O-demethylase oxidoreductase [Acinetobacter calcoaceticus]